MFRFEHPEYLFLLAALPLLLGGYLLLRFLQRRNMRAFGEERLIQQLIPGLSKYRAALKFFLTLLGLSLLIIGLANPQWGTRRETGKRKVVDVVIALDISRSMLATDVPPNRLEVAKKFAIELVQAIRSERIGSVIFAGNAYLQVPLTTDYAAVELFLRSANTDMAPSQGTAIGDAITLGLRSFPPESRANKAMIVISDGEDHQEEVIGQAEAAIEQGMVIYTVGVGTEAGSLIPVQVSGRNDFLRDQSGNTVRTHLQEELLRDIADAAQGTYYRLGYDTEEVVAAIEKELERLEKQEFEQPVFTEYESYFQLFLGAGVLLLILEFMLSHRSSGLRFGRRFLDS